MANNRDKPIGENEETEYHFTDDDITYEAEPIDTIEESKPEPVVQRRANFLADFGTRRIILSVVAFIILLFIVYKIVVPNKDRNTIMPVAANEAPMQPMQAASAPVTQTVTTQNAAPANTNYAPTTSNQAPTPVTVQQPPQNIPQSMASTTVTPSQPSNVPPPMQQNMSQTQTTEMPPVMAVQGSTPTYPASSQQVETGATQLNTINNQLVSQMQPDYNQKLAEVSQQNKQMEDEIQKLNATVSSIEARMNQLVQLMVRQQADTQQKAEENQVQSQANAGPKLPYTVQAIIPGRAWLRANNGDTITVTEGDTIRDAGKVTRIDPYDGIIEINTGRKTVTLSYGNGG